VSDAIEVPKFLVRPSEASTQRVEVTASWLAEQAAKQRRYADHRREVAALYWDGTPRPVLGGKIQDVRQERMAL
jgi:hypothetical protein